MSKKLRKIFVKFRNVIALLLVVVMTVSLVPVMGENVQAYAKEETENKNDITGSGTEQDPYKIYTYEGLKEFARIVNGESTLHENKPYVWGELANDIICTDKQWVPIGYYIDSIDHVEYTGHFDGKNYKVLYLSNEEIENVNGKDYHGLFGYIGEDGEVKNIGLENGSIYGRQYVGGIASINNGTISNCYNTGAVSGSYFVGGVVGDSNASGSGEATVANCYNIGAISGSVAFAGGVVGFNHASGSGEATVTNCYNTGAVFGNGYYVGGVVGRNYVSNPGVVTVTNCYNTGAVFGSDSYVGGVVGDNSAFYSGVATVTNCYNIGAISGSDAYVGGVVGYNLASNLGKATVTNCYYDSDRCKGINSVGSNDGNVDSTVKGLETRNMTGDEAFNEGHIQFSFDNQNDNPWLLMKNDDDNNNYFYPHLNGVNFTKKTGIPDNHVIDKNTVPVKDWPARILSGSTDGGSQDNPYEISDYNMLKQFSDIVNGTNGYTSNTSACAVLTNDIVCTDKTWTPIGYYIDRFNNKVSYKGTFNGQNYKIYNLNNNDVDDVNQKNYQGLFGTIGYIGTVKNICLESTNIQGDSYIGSISGKNSGTIENCYTNGFVYGNNNIGGIIGRNCAVRTNGSLIKNSYNAARVLGNNFVGGLAGSNFSQENFTLASITNCYNIGTVSGNNCVGGISGDNFIDIDGNIASVSNCYNVGVINGNNNVGNIVGRNFTYTNYQTASATHCYYDKKICLEDNGIGTGLMTAQMTEQDALNEYNMLFVYETDNDEESPWIVKTDEKVGDEVYWYYPHLKGFDHNENGEQLDANAISIDNWPGKVKVNYNWSEQNTEYTYNGEEQKPVLAAITIKVSDYNTVVLTNGTDYELSYKKLKGNNWVDNVSKEAGSYKTYVSFYSERKTDENTPGIICIRDACQDFTIKPKTLDSNAVVLSQTKYTYDGTRKIPTVTLMDGNIALPDTEYSIDITDNTNAGIATVTVSDNDGGNYTVNGTKTFIINKAEATVNADNITITYGEAIPTLTAKVSGLADVDKDKQNLINYTISRAKGTDVGTYTITPSGDAVQGNYNVTYETGTLTINKKQAGITESPKAISDLKYNGLEQSLITSGTAEDSCVILYTLGTDATTAPAADDENATDTEKKWRTNIPVGTDAGTYYVWYKVAGDKNHISSDASCITVTINKAEATVKADDITITYGDEEPTLTAKVTGLADIDKETQGIIKYTVSRTEGTDVDSYTITPSGDAEQGNYTVRYETGTLTIIKQLAGISENPKAVSGLVYSGAVQKLLTAGTAEDGITIYYALGNDNITVPVPDADDAAVKTWSTTIPCATYAGTYYVWFKAVADDNHDVNSAEAVCIPVTVEKASVTVKA